MNYLPTHPLILPTPCSYPRARFHPQRALMPPNDLRTMRGEAFAVLPAEHPIRADQRPYYEDPRRKTTSSRGGRLLLTPAAVADPYCTDAPRASKIRNYEMQ